ncbi:hypothetical protein FA95DRAFT_1606955 [Auriscalpium vulgare]|uniref:Uncharacterized protein n=1 Tax=Auriscalpium vulgare TaxID=40419 RepID=A0ACB8RQS4_9AGAM|nr:hypothetical protein FA95DRAFT_1606955 [Auriscalpium vulgare]
MRPKRHGAQWREREDVVPPHAIHHEEAHAQPHHTHRRHLDQIGFTDDQNLPAQARRGQLLQPPRGPSPFDDEIRYAHPSPDPLTSGKYSSTCLAIRPWHAPPPPPSGSPVSNPPSSTSYSVTALPALASDVSGGPGHAGQRLRRSFQTRTSPLASALESTTTGKAVNTRLRRGAGGRAHMLQDLHGRDGGGGGDQGGEPVELFEWVQEGLVMERPTTAPRR